MANLFSDDTKYRKTWLINREQARKLQILESNRDVDLKRVKSIYQAIVEGKWMPAIYIDKNYFIIDGQHRYYAYLMAWDNGIDCEMPVEEVVSDESTIDLVIAFNSKRKNWVAKNYMKSYCTRGNKNYLRVEKLMQRFPALDLKAAVQILKGSHSTSTFNNGALKVSPADYATALSRCRALQSMASHLSNIVFRRDIILAFYKVVDDIPDFQQFLQNIQDFKRPLTERNSDWIEAYKALF